MMSALAAVVIVESNKAAAMCLAIEHRSRGI
jgi:hypothetical protein